MLTITNIPFADLWITTVADTNSMDPTVDAGHTCILGRITDHSELQVGDVCIYTSPIGNIMHRIHETGEDENGRWYRFKGDNNRLVDRYRLRDAHITHVLIGIIY